MGPRQVQNCQRTKIDIASDEVTGQQATEILSNVLEYKIKYTPIQVANEDLADRYNLLPLG